MDSVDDLQGRLSRDIFARTKSPRKAAGRAMGTLVEIVAYYMLLSWGLRDSISIETPIEEYGARGISHNVDYSLHPVFEKRTIAFSQKNTISCKAIQNRLRSDGVEIKGTVAKNLLSKSSTLKNACRINKGGAHAWIANLDKNRVIVARQRTRPFMIIECKRVGIDAKGNTGPQAIEKAKQGSYVARAVSSLQKIRDSKGNAMGILYDHNNKPIIGNYESLISKIIKSGDTKLLSNFIITVGIVSDHGNWTTSGIPNKEIRVLQQSYDWLLFLTDHGLSCFVEEAIMSGNYPAIKSAFYSSYTRQNGNNQFTKSSMRHDAHLELLCYFTKNKARTEKWLNVMSPHKRTLNALKLQIKALQGREWEQ